MQTTIPQTHMMQSMIQSMIQPIFQTVSQPTVEPKKVGTRGRKPKTVKVQVDEVTVEVCSIKWVC